MPTLPAATQGDKARLRTFSLRGAALRSSAINSGMPEPAAPSKQHRVAASIATAPSGKAIQNAQLADCTHLRRTPSRASAASKNPAAMRPESAPPTPPSAACATWCHASSPPQRRRCRRAQRRNRAPDATRHAATRPPRSRVTACPMFGARAPDSACWCPVAPCASASAMFGACAADSTWYPVVVPSPPPPASLSPPFAPSQCMSVATVGCAVGARAQLREHWQRLARRDPRLASMARPGWLGRARARARGAATRSAGAGEGARVALARARAPLPLRRGSPLPTSTCTPRTEGSESAPRVVCMLNTPPADPHQPT